MKRQGKTMTELSDETRERLRRFAAVDDTWDDRIKKALDTLDAIESAVFGRRDGKQEKFECEQLIKEIERLEYFAMGEGMA